ncbi:cyclic lactone autoinducer peptide [Lucifera butyrica]|uniref:cyclic lactone autoinducer peptide n=1 Tax=Lucifera butyrica TaxID=1351585 RepID=UPI00351F9531
MLRHWNLQEGRRRRLKNLKRSFLYSLMKCMLSMALMFLIPACYTGLYQPQVPEHLQDR